MFKKARFVLNLLQNYKKKGKTYNYLGKFCIFA